jgi:hypothetical protein
MLIERTQGLQLMPGPKENFQILLAHVHVPRRGVHHQARRLPRLVFAGTSSQTLEDDLSNDSLYRSAIYL